MGRESIHLDDFDPLDFSSIHLQNLVSATMGDRRGVGVLEQIAIGPIARQASPASSTATSPDRQRPTTGRRAIAWSFAVRTILAKRVFDWLEETFIRVGSFS